MQQYTSLLEQMIKALLPLQPQTPLASELQPSNIPLEQSKVSQARKEQANQSSVREEEKGELVVSWTVAKDPLGKKEEDELYSLFMELRHSKKELQLEWLKRIHDLLKYWGSKWFRFKCDLVAELVDQFPKSKLKWLILEILRVVLRGINRNSQQLKANELDLISLNYPKPVAKP
jgi:hypothetical protein